MTTPTYPYPRLEHDGYQLAVVDQDSERVLAAPLPSDDERFAAGPGDLVKLVFKYREPDIRKMIEKPARVAERRKRNIVGTQVLRLRSAAKLTQDDLAARGALSGFDIGRASVSHIETVLRGMSDLEMVLLAKALRVPVTDLVPTKLPAWHKDVRPPNASEGEA